MTFSVRRVIIRANFRDFVRDASCVLKEYV